MQDKIVINPLPKIFDRVREDTQPFPPFTQYSCGTLEQLTNGANENRVDACTLPVQRIRRTMDFGCLENLCGED